MTKSDIKNFAKSLHLRAGTVVDVRDVAGVTWHSLTVESVTIFESAGIVGVSFVAKDGRKVVYPWTSIAAISSSEVG